MVKLTDYTTIISIVATHQPSTVLYFYLLNIYYILTYFLVIIIDYQLLYDF